MHISSLPGGFGIGDLGQKAFEFIDFLSSTGTKYWQVLPLNPTGFGDSPYQGLSAFAVNPLFIDLQHLVNLHLLEENDLKSSQRFSNNKVNFNKAIKFKRSILEKAFSAFYKNNKAPYKRELEFFKEENQGWLEDYCLFIAIRENYQMASWKNWPVPLKFREPQALLFFEEMHTEQVEFHAFLQFIFQKQWQQLKTYSHNKGIKFIGDIPIFVGYDCADVWAHPELFKLDKDLEPVVVAGVPPDYFSPTGQLWGNPIYDWEIHQKENYSWWISRIKETQKYVDVIRLDHFRGFAGYYQISSNARTAIGGQWIEGPGAEFFNKLNTELGHLPFIAEDLGVITPDVIELRDRFNLPGMKVLQFAFEGNAENVHLPSNYPENCVAYTGTHDNPTALDWYKNSLSKSERGLIKKYFGKIYENISQFMIRAAWKSKANLAIAPMQDFLGLGRRARMNTPATAQGNWRWRMPPDALTGMLLNWIKEINMTYDRFLRK